METTEQRINQGLDWVQERIEAVKQQLKELEPKVKQRQFESRVFMGLGLVLFIIAAFWNQPVFVISLICYGLSITWDIRGMKDSVAYEVAQMELESYRLALLITKVIVKGGRDGTN